MTRLDDTVKSDLREQARARVTAALKGELEEGFAELTYAELQRAFSGGGAPTDLGVAITDEYETARYNAFSSMLSTRDELERRARRAAQDLTDAIPYLHGDVGSFNNLGILQSEGPAIDRLVGVFSVQVEAAADAAYRLLLAVARQQAAVQS